MEVLSGKIITPGKQDVHVTFYSDLHLGSSECDEKTLRAHMDERAALKNSVFVGLGDLGDFILPADKKRFVLGRNSCAELNVASYATALEEHVYKFIKPYRWLMLGMGNHCLEVLKRHSVNPMANLANKLKVLYGGYSGFLRVALVPYQGTSKGPRDTVTFLYHHGGGGGAVTKGLPWAKRFASNYLDWDVFCWGHNHQAQIHHEIALRPTQHDTLSAVDRYLVNTGTFLKSYSSDNDCPCYSEVAGMAPVALTAPTVQITPPVRSGRTTKLRIWF